MAKQLAVVPDVEAELDRLFGLPPAEFTAARNDLARRLKQAGQAAISARVRELRKPTVPVWTVNQLARRHSKDVEALLEAVERLRSAQEAALGGGDAQRLRSATSDEREALRGLTHRAHDFLDAEGHKPTAAVIERIASMLRAAALDPDGRDLLLAGRLTEELESAGFGAFAGMKIPTAPTGPKRKPKTKQGGAESAAERRRDERLRKLRDRAHKLASEAVETKREAERAETAAERARRKAERASAAATKASAELEAAETD